jgi:O-antigen/teichoic acid export membrane protein
MSSRIQLSKRLFLVNSASSVLRRILYVSVLIWLNQYLLRRIGDVEYSLYPLVSSVVLFIPLFSMFLTAGLARFVTEAYALGDDEKVTSIVSTMAVLLLVVAVGCLAGGLVFSWHIGHLLTIPPGRLWDARIMFALLVCCTAMRLPLTPFEFGLYVEQRFVLQNLIGLLVEIVKISLLFALLFGVSTRVLWLVVAEVLAQSLSSAVMVVISLKRVPAMRFCARRIDWSIARRIMGFGGWSLVINCAASAQRILDPVFLNKLARLGDVTSYHIGTMPMRHIQSFAAVAVAPLLPQLIGMHATGRHEQMRNLYLRGGRYGLWIVLCVTLPAIVYCRELITLYLGPAYIEMAFVMVLALLTTIWGFSHWMLPQLCQAKDQMRPMALRYAAIQVVRIALVLYFVGWLRLGALGLAGAGLVAAAAHGAVSLPLSWRLVEIGPGQWFREVMVRGLLPGAPATLVWVGLEIVHPPTTWALLGLYVAAGLVVYLAVLVLYSFDTYDRTQIREIVGALVRGCQRLQPRPSSLSAVSSGTGSEEPDRS